jgi:hypothetical protein
MTASVCCAGLSLIKPELAELLVRHAHNWCIRAGDPRSGVLELVDLAGVKINKPKPGRLSMIMY